MMLLNCVKRFQVPLFFALSLVISWSIWIPEALTTLSNREAAFGGSGLLDVLAVWGPGLSGILLSFLVVGKIGVRALFSPLRRWRIGITWYFFVLLYPAAIWLIAQTIDSLFGRSYELSFMPIMTYFGANQTGMAIIALVFALPNTLGEELGWRGFALPNLQMKYTALLSSIILGLFWAVWHIPLWIAGGQMGIGLLVNVVFITGTAILYTWVYNSTGGSLLLIWLFHFAMTVTGYLLSSIPTLTDDILRLGVVILIIFMTRARLSSK
ncbi:MAG: type II CAAX endopeptidase family protein [Candidatus Methanofastidiosia archaeon]